jgi:tetratricopeptide (TPR) repeat protein
VAHFYYANFLTALSRFEETIAEAREAVRLDPVSMVAEANLAILYYNAGRHDEALAACQKALELEPNLARPYDDLGRVLLEKGNFSEAIAALQKAVLLSIAVLDAFLPLHTATESQGNWIWRVKL